MTKTGMIRQKEGGPAAVYKRVINAKSTKRDCPQIIQIKAD